MTDTTGSLRVQLLEAGIARLDFAFCYYTDTTHIDGLRAFDTQSLEIELTDELRSAAREALRKVCDWNDGFWNGEYGVYSWFLTPHTVIRAGAYQLTNPFEVDGSSALYYRTEDPQMFATATTWTSANPPEELEAIPDSPDVFLRRALAENPNAPTHIVVKLAGDADEPTRSRAREHRFLPKRTIKAIEADKGMAFTPHLEPELLGILAESQWSTVRQAVAMHPGLPRASLERLARDPIPQVRVAILGNPNAPDALKSRLIEDLNNLPGNLRENIAADEETPHAALEVLSMDWLLAVRRAVMHNPATPPQLLKRFAFECDTNMRHELLREFGLNHEILEVLTSDPDEHIRAKAQARLQPSPRVIHEEYAGSRREAWARSELTWMRYTVVCDEKTPDDLLELFVDDPHGLIRETLLGRHANWWRVDSPSKRQAIKLLARDRETTVRLQVARFARDLDVIEGLAQDPDPSVLYELVRSFDPNLSERVPEHIVTRVRKRLNEWQ